MPQKGDSGSNEVTVSCGWIHFLENDSGKALVKVLVSRTPRAVQWLCCDFKTRAEIDEKPGKTETTLHPGLCPSHTSTAESIPSLIQQGSMQPDAVKTKKVPVSSA